MFCLVIIYDVKHAKQQKRTRGYKFDKDGAFYLKFADWHKKKLTRFMKSVTKGTVDNQHFFWIIADDDTESLKVNDDKPNKLGWTLKCMSTSICLCVYVSHLMSGNKSNRRFKLSYTTTEAMKNKKKVQFVYSKKKEPKLTDKHIVDLMKCMTLYFT